MTILYCWLSLSLQTGYAFENRLVLVVFDEDSIHFYSVLARADVPDSGFEVTHRTTTEIETAASETNFI